MHIKGILLTFFTVICLVSCTVFHYSCDVGNNSTRNTILKGISDVEHFQPTLPGRFHLISHSSDLCSSPEVDAVCRKGCVPVSAPISKVEVDPGFGTEIDPDKDDIITMPDGHTTRSLLSIESIESHIVENYSSSESLAAVGNVGKKPLLVKHLNLNSRSELFRSPSLQSEGDSDELLALADDDQLGISGFFYVDLSKEEQDEFLEDLVDSMKLAQCLDEELSEDEIAEWKSMVSTTSRSFTIHPPAFRLELFRCEPHSRDPVFVEALSHLSFHPSLQRVHSIRPARLYNVGASKIMLGGDDLPVRNEEGLRGKNVVVTVTDTGFIAHNTTAFDGDDGESRVVNYQNISRLLSAYSDCENGESCYNHGTHVAGSVGGRIEDATGIAPDVAYYMVALTTGDDTQELVVDDILYTEIWPDAYDNYNSRVFTNSWGFEAVAQSGNSPRYNWYQADDWFVDRFVWQHPEATVLFASGNSGKLVNSLGHPSRAKNLIVVGATVNHPDSSVVACQDASLSGIMRECTCYGSNIDEKAAEVFEPMCKDPSSVVWFSSAGPTWAGRRGVDVVSPGSAVYSLDWGSGSYERPAARWDAGTSMATPLTAGAVALVVEKLKELEANDVAPYADLVRSLMIAGATREEDAMFNHDATLKATQYSYPGKYISSLGRGYSIHGGYGHTNVEESIKYVSLDHLIQVGKLDDLAFDSPIDGFVENPGSKNLRYVTVRKPSGQSSIRFVLSWIEPPMTLENYLVEIGWENLMNIDMYVTYTRPGESSKILRVSNAPQKSYDDDTDYFGLRNGRDTTQYVEIYDAPEDEDIDFDVYLVLREQMPEFDTEKSPFAFVTTGLITSEMTLPDSLPVPNCYEPYTVDGNKMEDGRCVCVDTEDYTAMLEDCSLKVETFHLSQTGGVSFDILPLQTKFFRMNVDDDGDGGHRFLLYRRKNEVIRTDDYCPTPYDSYEVQGDTVYNGPAWLYVTPTFHQWLHTSIHFAVQADSFPDPVESGLYSYDNAASNDTSYFTRSIWYNNKSNIQYTYGGQPAAKMTLPNKVLPGTHIFSVTNFHAFYKEELQLEIDYPLRYSTDAFKLSTKTILIIIIIIVGLIVWATIYIMLAREKNLQVAIKKSRRKKRSKRSATKTTASKKRFFLFGSRKDDVFTPFAEEEDGFPGEENRHKQYNELSSNERADNSSSDGDVLFCDDSSASNSSYMDSDGIDEAITIMKMGQLTTVSNREEQRKLSQISSKRAKKSWRTHREIKKKEKEIAAIENIPIELKRGFRLTERMKTNGQVESTTAVTTHDSNTSRPKAQPDDMFTLKEGESESDMELRY